MAKTTKKALLAMLDNTNRMMSFQVGDWVWLKTMRGMPAVQIVSIVGDIATLSDGQVGHRGRLTRATKGAVAK